MLNARRYAINTPLMNVMIGAVEKASQRLPRDFGEVERLQVKEKGPGDFVTVADHRTEKVLFEELKKARSRFGFLMEESGEVKGEDSNNRWVIDPIDGTNNFLHGIPHFCISVGLQRQHEVIGAVIFDPIKNEMFYAEKGQGAFMNDQRIRVSGRTKLQNCLIGVGGASMRQNREDYYKLHQTISPQVACMRQSGSAALDLAYVAAGRYDGFYDMNLRPWDLAAGILLIREAGGQVTDMKGGDDMMTNGGILAANVDLHSSLKKLLLNS